MAGYDFNNPPEEPKGRFGAKQKAGDVSVPGANTSNKKLSVSAKKEKAKKDDGSGMFAAPDEQDLGPQQKRRFRFRKNEEVSIYEEELDDRYAMDPRGKMTVVLIVGIIVAFVIAMILPTGMFVAGGNPFTVAGFIGGIKNDVSGLLDFFSGANPHDPMGYRFFKYLMIILAGAALGISGGVYQGALKNALASPTTLGVMSGGTLGAMFFVILGTEEAAENVISKSQEVSDHFASLSPFQYVIEMYSAAGASLLGSLAVVAFVLIVATVAGRGKVSNVALIVTGQVVTMLAGSVMTVIRLYYESGVAEGSELKSQALSAIRTASFSNLYGIYDLVLMGIPVVICVGIIFALRLRMNVLTFSDEEARSMGLSPNMTRNLMVGACTVMTAMVVAFCGSVGFVGFIVPHLTRRVVGPNFKYYIPATALVGSLFLVIVYILTSFGPFEVFGGARLITSVLGGIMFIVIALRGRNRMVSDGF